LSGARRGHRPWPHDPPNRCPTHCNACIRAAISWAKTRCGTRRAGGCGGSILWPLPCAGATATAPQGGRIVLPEITGGIALNGDGRLILLGRDGISPFDPETGAQTLLINPEADRSDNRFNTTNTDATGSIWASTMAMDHSPGAGRFSRIDGGLNVTLLRDGPDLPKNGAFSPDGRTFHHAEGGAGVLLATQWDTRKGRLSQGRVFLRGSPDIGLPNGIACDCEGGLWVTMLGGWTIRRDLPDGTLDRIVPLPLPMLTGVCFGGAERRTLFTTSTYLRLPPGYQAHAPLSGNVLSIPVGVPGPAVVPFGEPT